MQRYLAVCVFLLGSGIGIAQEAGLQKLAPDARIVWEKAGSEIGWYGRTNDGGWQYTTVTPQDKNAIVAVWWSLDAKREGFDKLPAPTVPFALFLGSTVGYPQVTDAAMKDIARFRTLQHLAIQGNRDVTDAGVEAISVLDDSLQGLVLSGLPISDAGAKHIAKLQGMQYLMVGATQISDAGVKDLARLKHLHSLGLARTQITDAALKDIAGLEKLEELWLHKNAITDKGLVHLAGLKRLKHLSLIDTKVTPQGIQKLQQQLPKLQIH